MSQCDTFMAKQLRGRLGFGSRDPAMKMDFVHSKNRWIRALRTIRGTYQIVINVNGIVEHGSPVECSICLNLVSEAFSVRVCLPVEAVTIAPTRWSVQIEINSMSNQVIWVGCWWNDGTSNVLALSTESMGDPDGDLIKLSIKRLYWSVDVRVSV